ncbi:MAG: polysaccharide pyruvyl transferase family protein [Dehalococcoidia bacterium]|nr:polysaccharide pyruvyl transferase family protein [Dehalococcoidia bacterium]
MLRTQKLSNIILSSQSPISFAISSVGTRDEFIDNFVIPSILKQGIETFEVIIAGHYRGEYLQKTNIRYVPVRKFPVYFYKHVQKAISECRYDWIVDLDDDMVLADDWYSNLIASVKTTADADIYGFRLLNPDGSIYADIGDVFGLVQADHRIRPTSYFGSYIAKKAIFESLPYPTYMSGDRHHGLLISKHGFKKEFLPGVCVIHSGALGRKGAIPRASSERYHNTIELRKRLGLLTKTSNADYREKALKWFQYASKLEKKTKKIGIWGWFGHGNVGDELILSSMIAALSHHEISVYTDRPEGVENGYNVRRVFHTEELRKHLNELDLLLIGGGGVLHNRAITKSFPKELMRNCETPIIVYAAGIPFFDWCNDLYYFLSKCYLVTLRDNLCLSFIKQRFTDIPAQLLPDPAFMIPKLQSRKVPGKIVLNTRMIPEGWRQGLPANVNEILREELSSIYHHLVSKNYSPLVLGFESRDEEMLSNQGYRYKMVNFKEAVEEIATAELLIGARYHSGVIAITQHTPAILLNYQKKIEGLKTFISTGINVVNIKNLNLIREFDAFRHRKNEHKLPEIEALRGIITEFNDMYINYVY